MNSPLESSILWEASLPVEGLGGVVTPMTYSVVRRWTASMMEAWRGMLAGDRGSGPAVMPADSVVGFLRGRIFVNQQAVDAWITACAVDAQEQTLLRLAVGGPLAEAATSLAGRGKTDNASWTERISRMDRLLWRLRGAERRADAAAGDWDASLKLPTADASTQTLLHALLLEDHAFRSRVGVFAEVSIALALLTAEVQRALDGASVPNAAAAARRLVASNARTWEVDLLQSTVDLAKTLAGAKGLKDALGGEESRLVEALFAYREVGKQLDGWLETYQWLSDDPARLESERWAANPVVVLKRLSSWCERAPEIVIKAPDSGDAGELLRKVPSFARRQFLGWAMRRARRLQPSSHRLMLQVMRSAGRMHQILTQLGADLAKRGILAEAGDVHALTFEEVIGWAYGSSPSSWLRETASYRKAETSLNASGASGTTLVETPLPVHLGNPLRGTLAARAEGGRVSGWSVGSGIKVSGKVRLVAPSQAPSAQPGELLVGERGSPSWVLAVPASTGVVLELDRASSSVVQFCRWMGKPVVIRATGGTALAQDGDEVELDGASGAARKVGAVEVK